MTTRRGTASDQPALRITGPGDLVQLVPFLLGFHPGESLVIVGLAHGAVVVTVRMDLADVVADRGPDVLADTLRSMADGGTRDLIGMVFDDRAVPAGARPPDPLPWHGVRAALEVEAERIGVTVSDVMLVSARRWWSYCCPDPGCCPPEGQPLDEESSEVPAAAAFAGLVALPDRAALAALLDPDPVEALAPRLAAAERDLRAAADGGRSERSAKRAMFAAARAADRPGGGPGGGDADLVRFGAALALRPVRDAIWLAVDERRLDGREFWRWLGRRLPGRHAAAPLFLFGWASWRAGNGAIAGMAAERALEADPAYTAADLLLAALSYRMDPRRAPRLRQRSA